MIALDNINYYYHMGLNYFLEMIDPLLLTVLPPWLAEIVHYWLMVSYFCGFCCLVFMPFAAIHKLSMLLDNYESCEAIHKGKEIYPICENETVKK